MGGGPFFPTLALAVPAWLTGAGAAAGVVLLLVACAAGCLLMRRAGSIARRSYERQLAALAENFPGALFRRRFWPDGRVSYDFISVGAASMFGASKEWRGARSMDELTSRVAPEDRAAWREAMEKSVREVSPLDLEVRVLLPDGGSRWIRTIAKGWREGAAVVFDGVAFDVTAQKLAEARLRETERRLAAIVDGSRDAIWSWTSDGMITSWNAEAERMFGYAAAEAVGSSILMLVPPERHATAVEVIGHLQQGDWFEQYETVRIAKGGGRVEVELTVSPIRDQSGTVVGAATICRDITRRREAETALLRNEELLRLSQQAGRVGSFEWDVESARARYSPEFERIYGAPAGSLGEAFEDWLERVHPEDRERAREYQRTALTGGEAERQLEFRIVRPDGGVRWVEARSRALHGSAGAPLRVVGINVDVTERKETEDRQALLLREFNHRVKNVLANIRALALQTKLSLGPGDDFVGSFEGRLETFARTHAALLDDDREAAPLRALAEQELAPYAGVANVAEIDGPDLSLRIQAAHMLAMALHELATNAAKYGALSTPGGRVLLRWRLERTEGELQVQVLWQEADGPEVAPPQRKGFGRSLMERGVAAGLGGSARLEFAPSGVRYEITFPAARNVAAPEVGAASGI